MRKNNKEKLLFYVLIGLAVIGALRLIFQNPGRALIPILVFGGIFLLYKYPPHKWRMLWFQAQSKYFGSTRGVRGGRRMKRAKFRVIPGTKKDGDEPPKYH